MNMSSSYCLRVSIPRLLDTGATPRTNPKHGKSFYFGSRSLSTLNLVVEQRYGYRLSGLRGVRVGRAQNEGIGGRQNAQHRGILHRERLRPMLAVARDEARSYVVLPRVVGGQG